MKFTSATQLKDWIKNKSKLTGAPANTLLQIYMTERLLERISKSPYRENFILKGGFLIAAMIGVDRRATMDMDATIKGLLVNREKIENIMNEIISIDIGDGVIFSIREIKNIRNTGEYDDCRIFIRALLYTVVIEMKIDVTTGDVIIPKEIEYSYKLMFEDRTIPVMAYNIYAILAEKIETILSRNVTNSRGRDFYDVYILLSTNRDNFMRDELIRALNVKAEERGSVHLINNYAKHLIDIAESPEITMIWGRYVKKYIYAKGIVLQDIIALIEWVFKG